MSSTTFVPRQTLITADWLNEVDLSTYGVQRYGAVGDGVTDDTAAFQAALTASSFVWVPKPPVAYKLNSTLVAVSGRSLIGEGGQIPITGSASSLISLVGVTNFLMEGFVITGPHSGTGYQIAFSANSKYNKFRKIKITNGNSGFDITDSSENILEDIELRNMRGTGIKLTGASCTKNVVRNIQVINGSLFGIFVDNSASDNTISNVEKRLDSTSVTSYQTTNEAADLANGRIGLECIGLTVSTTRNTISNIRALDTGDNGVSVTGSKNTLTNITAINCDNDGLHIYGSHNSVSGVNVRNNAQTGLGIVQSSTTGGATGNIVVGVVSEDNTYHGIQIGDVATNNIVIGHVSGNGRGPYLVDATDPTTNRIAVNGHWAIATTPTPTMDWGGYNFNGSSTYLDGNAYTGIADGKKGTIFIIARFANAATGTETLHDSTGNRFQITRTSLGQIRVVAKNTTPTNILDMSTTGFPRPCLSAGTYAIMISFDLTTAGSSRIWVNDQPFNTVETTFTNDTIDYTTTENSIGGSPSGGSLFSGDVYTFWFDPTQNLEFNTESIRRRFVDPNGVPVWLGANGELPTGTAPIVFHAYDKSGNWPLQRGQASSSWTRNGAEADAATTLRGQFGDAKTVITTVTADYTVRTTDRYIINNRAATNTLTLPSAATCIGRPLSISTIQAQQVDSASSNVIPRAGGAAGTAILGASDGAWATLVATASGWQIMSGS